MVSPDPRGSLGGNNNSPPPSNGGVQNPGDIGGLLNGQTGPADSYRGTQSTERTETFFALQQAFVEFHLADLSDNYDFISLRVGNQPFNADFRGFLFNDVNLGARLFGNCGQQSLPIQSRRVRHARKRHGLGTEHVQQSRPGSRHRKFIPAGFFLAGLHGGVEFSRELRPRRHCITTTTEISSAPNRSARCAPHDENVYYLGWGGDGHIGRFNVSHQFYEALGHDDFNGLAGRPVDINAQMAALEVSYDRDWARYKASFFYASGDGNATDGTGQRLRHDRGQSEFHRRPVQFLGAAGISISAARW